MKTAAQYLTCATIALASCAASAAEPARSIGNVADPDSIGGGGRNIMRTAEGALVSSFTGSSQGKTQLYFSSSNDGGKTWYTVKPIDVGRSSDVLYPSIDSNFVGAYLGYVDESDGRRTGRVLYSPNPLAKDKQFVASEALTPALAGIEGSFIAASRTGWGNKPNRVPNTVAYGWSDRAKGDLYVGVSPDGLSFPKAAVAYSSPHVKSAPAVTVHGDYVFLTFLTDDPALSPSDLNGSVKGKLYPAWIESRDRGRSWSKPVPMFGRSVKDFPKLSAAQARADGLTVKGAVYAAGGSGGWLTQNLVWMTTTGGEEIIFSMNSMSPVAATEALESASIEDPQNLIGVVSFRKMKPGSEWTHVPANLDLFSSPEGRNKLDRRLSPFGIRLADAGGRGGQHQYSALVDTPIRATTYVERGSDDPAGDISIVVVSSVDTGKSFDHFVKFDEPALRSLGLPDLGDEVRIDVSQCLFEDRDGQVYVDVLVHDVGRSNDIRYLKLPLGVNAQPLRAREQRALAAAATAAAAPR